MPYPPHWPNRDALLDAILVSITQSGFTHWSLRTLATHLGVSTYTLTYHFGSKEQLIGVVLTRFEGQMQAMMREWAKEPSMATAHLLQRYWDWLVAPEHTSFGQVFFEIYGQALRRPDQFGHFLQSGFPAWNRQLQQQLERDGVRSPSPTIVASILVASVTGLYLDWLTLHETARTSQTIAYLCQWVNSLIGQ
jgi:AcrR family transcriptional regulator